MENMIENDDMDDKYFIRTVKDKAWHSSGQRFDILGMLAWALEHQMGQMTHDPHTHVSLMGSWSPQMIEYDRRDGLRSLRN